MKISTIEVNYTQDVDCCDNSGEEFQELVIKTDDGGGGPYVILSTRRWAMDRDGIARLAGELRRVLREAERLPFFNDEGKNRDNG